VAAPVVGVGRLGGVLGIDVVRLGREHVVGVLEMVFIGRGCERYSEDAAPADGRRDLALRSGPVDVMRCIAKVTAIVKIDGIIIHDPAVRCRR
jgi:hypothetical protein